jgi:hypothetical protein
MCFRERHYFADCGCRRTEFVAESISQQVGRFVFFMPYVTEFEKNSKMFHHRQNAFYSCFELNAAFLEIFYAG